MPVRASYPLGQSAFSFNVRLSDPSATALVDHVALLRDCVAVTKRRWSFEVRAASVLPSALHMVWTLPEGDGDFLRRWRMIKSTFARHLPASQTPAGAPLWQRPIWEIPIRDAAELSLHELHCLTAPVRAGLVRYPEDWPWSSLRRPPGRGRGAPPVTRAGHLRLVG